MIDLHAHVLPGVDDGPKTVEDTVAVLRQARADGIRYIVAVAHANDHHFNVSRDDYIAAFLEATDAVSRAGLDVQLIPAMEVRLGADLAEGYNAGRYLPIGETGYICVELPATDFPGYTLDALFQLSLEGLRIMVIHPERNRGLRRRPELVDRLIHMEVLGVASAGSLTGQFGPDVLEAAWHMMGSGLIQSVASDGHSVDKRPLRLSHVAKLLRRRFGDSAADFMVNQVPKLVLGGQPVELAPKRRTGWLRLWRR